MDTDGNLRALEAFERTEEARERRWEHFCSTIESAGVLTHYDEAKSEYDRIASNFDVDMSFTEWINLNY